MPCINKCLVTIIIIPKHPSKPGEKLINATMNYTGWYMAFDLQFSYYVALAPPALCVSRIFRHSKYVIWWWLLLCNITLLYIVCACALRTLAHVYHPHSIYFFYRNQYFPQTNFSARHRFRWTEVRTRCDKYLLSNTAREKQTPNKMSCSRDTPPPSPRTPKLPQPRRWDDCSTPPIELYDTADQYSPLRNTPPHTRSIPKTVDNPPKTVR